MIGINYFFSTHISCWWLSILHGGNMKRNRLKNKLFIFKAIQLTFKAHIFKVCRIYLNILIVRRINCRFIVILSTYLFFAFYHHMSLSHHLKKTAILGRAEIWLSKRENENKKHSTHFFHQTKKFESNFR